MTLGELIRNYRIARGLSLDDVAAAAIGDGR